VHSSVASFYGGYDLVPRVHSHPRRLSPVILLVAMAVLVLLVFVAADVSAFQALPVPVRVTSVEWLAGSELLATAGGFSMHTSQSVTLSLSCDSLCYAITSGAVRAPFHLAGFVVTYAPSQFVNVTVVAPSSAYTGAVVITLS